MGTIFRCSSILPYRPRILHHEHNFKAFITWTTVLRNSLQEPVASNDNFSLGSSNLSYVVQLVCQVNYGPLESKRYFAKATEQEGEESFVEVTQGNLIDANYQKLNW